MDNATELLPLGIAATALRVSRAWLKAEAEAGRVPCLNAGGRLLFNLGAVRQLLAERAAKPVRDPGTTASGAPQR